MTILGLKKKKKKTVTKSKTTSRKFLYTGPMPGS